MEEINFSEMQVYDFSNLNSQEKEYVSSHYDFQNSCDSCDSCDHW